MASSRGKLFEREFRAGLESLCGGQDLSCGRAIRLFDGTNFAPMRQPADFIYASTNGKTYMVECKSTSEASMPFANIREHQIPSLLRWEGMNRVGLLAVEFWRERRAFLIHAGDVARLIADGDRKSLPLPRAEQLGREIQRIRAGGSFMYDLSVLEMDWVP